MTIKVIENFLFQVLRIYFRAYKGHGMIHMGLWPFFQIILDFFLSVGLGLGGTDTPEARFRKSISSERTFSATQDAALLYQKLGRWLISFFFSPLDLDIGSLFSVLTCLALVFITFLKLKIFLYKLSRNELN